MVQLINFLANNYIWFLVISIILIFALVGYLVDTKQDERFTRAIKFDEELANKIEIAKAANITISDMVKDRGKNEQVKAAEAAEQSEPESLDETSNGKIDSLK